MAFTLVLSVGLNASLLRARTLVQPSAGYTVIEAFSLKEVADARVEVASPHHGARENVYRSRNLQKVGIGAQESNLAPQEKDSFS